MVGTNSYFDNLVESSDDLSEFKNDLGLRLISENLEYSIERTEESIKNAISGLYDPKEELILLAHLMYRVGYLRLKKPLVISATITSGDAVILPKGTRFSDGIDVYYLNDAVSLQENIEGVITLTNSLEFNSTHTVQSAKRYYKIATGLTYRELSGFEVKLGNKRLTYSQLFVANDSELSLEIQSDGKIFIVVLIGNTSGVNISIGDELSVKLISTPDTNKAPSNLAIIENGFNIAIPSINVLRNYEPPMSIQGMKDMVQFGRKNIGDIVLNEDYNQFLLKSVSGIEMIKSWQERDETRETGYKLSNINKVFVSYIGVDSNIGLDAEIVNAINAFIYGKAVEIKTAVIIPFFVGITIKTNEGVSAELINNIKAGLVGYYDGIKRRKSKSAIYKTVFEIVSESISVFDLTVNTTDTGVYKNREFFEIKNDNISIYTIKAEYGD